MAQDERRKLISLMIFRSAEGVKAGGTRSIPNLFSDLREPTFTLTLAGHVIESAHYL